MADWKIVPICGSENNVFVYKMLPSGAWYYDIKVFNFVFIIPEEIRINKRSDSKEVIAKKELKIAAEEKRARKEWNDRIEKWIKNR